MADSSITIFNADGGSALIDLRTPADGTEGRQVIAIGDADTNLAIVDVVSADPGPTSTLYGAVVRLAGSAQVQIAGATGSLAVTPQTPAGTSITDEGHDAQRVLIVGSHTAGSLMVTGQQAAGTNRPLIVNTDGAVKVYDITTGTIATVSTVSAVTNVTNSIAVVLFTPAGSGVTDEGHDAVRVLIAGSHSAGSLVISGQQAAGTNRPLIVNTDGAVKVYDIAQGTVSISGTPTVRDISATGVLNVTASTSASGVSVSGNTVVSPVVGSVIKVCAFSLTTTAQVHLAARFTNGAGTGPTEFWRVALQAPAKGIAGANLAVTPPGYLWATAAGSTLSLVLDSASLVHYAVSYFRESA